MCTELPENIPHACGLDTLDADPCTEESPKGDETLHKSAGGLFFFDVPHKTAVDLDRVKGNLFENVDRGKAGPKIVQRDADAAGFQPDDHVFQKLQIQQPAALGHLEADQGRRASLLLQDLQHPICKLRLFKLGIGQIDIDDKVGILLPHLF